MSHFEERIERDLKRLREHVSSLSIRVQTAVENAVHALLVGDHELSYATILGDAPINRLVRQIDKLCHSFIALHLPGAGQLRLISSIIRVNIELERVGDYAVKISREAVQLAQPPSGTVAREVALMAEESRAILKQAIEAFGSGNADVAKATMPAADRVGNTFSLALDELIADEGNRNARDLLGLFAVFTSLERVSDQAKNICEETVFAIVGETKAAKVYRVLFVDEHNSCQGQLAEAIARKMYPGSGEYRSAGRTPAAQLAPGLAEFLAERGLDPAGRVPCRLDLTSDELTRVQVVISLEGPIKSYLPHVPYETVALAWDVGAAPQGLDAAATRDRLSEIYRELAQRIRVLMETLRGEEAP